jgi:prolyl 4-hydroxylase
VGSKISFVKPAYERSYVLSADPMVAYLDDFLSADECLHIIEIARNKLKRARVSRKGDESVTKGRTNQNAWVSHDTDEIVLAVSSRISKLVGIPLENAEALQVIYYDVDQQYKAHFDAYDLSKDLGRHYTRRGGQRLVTTLTYLNDVEEGGGTSFPKLDIEIEARKGRLAIFHNCIAGTNDVHPNSLHSGLPVVCGEKWAFNIWFHERPMDDRSSENNDNQKVSSDDSKGLRVNRAERLFKTAYEALPENCLEKRDQFIFTYWDEYGGNQLDLSEVRGDVPVYRLIQRPILNQLADKANLAKTMEIHGLHEFSPTTYLSKEEALQHVGDPVKIWFIKNAFGTAGKDMRCVRHEDLASHHVPEHFIIQAAIEGIELIDEKKFTTRIYALIWSGKLFLYSNGINVVHGERFQENSTDYDIQINHAGYHKADSKIKMIQLREYDKYDMYFPVFKRYLKMLLPIFQPCIDASSDYEYVLLGIDVILVKNGEVRLVEVNTVPNFIHTNEINTKVNVPFMSAVICKMLTHDDDEKLVEI